MKWYHWRRLRCMFAMRKNHPIDPYEDIQVLDSGYCLDRVVKGDKYAT